MLIQYLFILLTWFLGACLGSFYALCISRYIDGVSLFKHSYCPECGKRIKAYHLIPILSWLMLGTRCAYCHKPIQALSFILECFTAMVCVLLALKFGFTPAFFVAVIITGALIIASFIDFLTFILPDIIIIPLAFVAFPSAVFFFDIHWLDSLTGAIVGAGLFLSIKYFFKKLKNIDCLGFGDVKLMISLGFLSGITGLSALLLIGCGLALLASSLWVKDLENDIQIPFGPFLSLGAFINLFIGKYLWFYSNMFFEKLLF